MSRVEDLRILNYFHTEKSIDRCVAAEELLVRNPDVARRYERLKDAEVDFELFLKAALGDAEAAE